MNAKANLLDCSLEPTDEQLDDLMRGVAAEALAKARVANTALMQDVHRQVAEVRERYRLTREPTAGRAS